MRHAHSGFATLLVFLTIACSPVVTTHTKAPGVHISGESIPEGKDRIVKVTIAPKKEGTQWNVEFVGSTPEDLKVSVDNGITRLHWKLGQDHIKSFGIDPYELKLSSGGETFNARVNFTTPSQQIIVGIIEVLVSFH